MIRVADRLPETLVRVASLNACLLAKPGFRFHDEAPYSEAEYAAKTGWLGGLLDRAGVDIVGFQEVFHEEALIEVAARSSRFADAYVAAPDARKNLPTNPDGALIAPRLGLMSRFPVKELTSIPLFPEDMPDSFAAPRDANGYQHAVSTGIRRFERPVLRAVIELPDGTPMILYVVHLKSRRGAILDGENQHDPAIRAAAVVRGLLQRGAEAAALRVLLTKDMADRGQPAKPVILVGDLNDGPEAVTTQLIRGDEPLPESFRPIMEEPEEWLKKNRRLWDLHLYDSAEIAAGARRGDRATHIHFGEWTRIDHILVSQEFAHSNPGRIGSVRYHRVYNDHLADRHVTDFGAADRTTTDHGVPVVELVLGE